MSILNKGKPSGPTMAAPQPAPGTAASMPLPEQEQPNPAPGTAVAQPAASSVAVIDYGDDAGAGLENIGQGEYRIPLVRILQKGSPQVQPEGGLPGATTSMIFNTSTGQFWDGKAGMVFIPVFRDHNYVEYIPREQGGGFVGIHDPLADEIVALREKQGQFVTLKTDRATEIKETYYLYGLLLTPDDEVQMDVLPFTSKQIPKYQALVTRYLGITYPGRDGKLVRPPIWAHRWHVSTKFEKNKKGDWYGWALRMDKPTTLESRLATDDPLYLQAKGFYEMLKSGRAKADYTADTKAGGEAAQVDADIPF